MFSVTDSRTVFNLTDAATAKVRELLEAEGDPALALRVAVRPGGCSGYSYEMFFDGDIAADDCGHRFRRGEGRHRPRQRAAARRGHARLQGRPPGRGVPCQQPQRQPQLRLRAVVQLS